MSAKTICNETKYCCITQLLVDLHWLPIYFRTEFKILLIVFKVFKGLEPSYLSSLITRKPESRYNLRISCFSALLSYPFIKSKPTLRDRTLLSSLLQRYLVSKPLSAAGISRGG